MKRKNYVCAVLGTALMLAMSACGGAKSAPAETKKTEAPAETSAAKAEETKAAEKKSAEAIYEEICSDLSLEGMMTMPAQYVENYYGIDVEAYPDSVFAVSEESTGAETVIIVKTEDESAVDEIAGLLETVLEAKKNELKNYAPDQYKIAEKSKIRKSKNAVYLVISEQEDEIVKIVEAGL